MKKQDKNPLDQFFRENTEQHFPYDPALWSKADKDIGALFGKRYRMVFLALLLVFMSSIAVFFAYDNHGKAGKISMFKKSGNSVLTEKSTTVKSKGNIEGKGENTTYVSTKNETIVANASTASSTETTISGNPNTPLESEGQNPYTKEEETNPSKQKDINTKDDIINKEESQSNAESVQVGKEEDPVADVNNLKERIDYTNFSMFSKPFQAFPFSGITQNPESNYINLDRKKRKFATTIEFENLNSIFLEHKLSGLQKQELDYKNKYEREKSSKGYSLNIMLQRGGFGLVTGLGYADAVIKTGYISTSNTFELSEAKYKMLDDSVRQSQTGTSWNNIKEYRDTIARHSQEGVLKGQASQNVFQWIKVPLKFSYQKSLYRLRFSARVGLDFMWLYNTKGTFINSNLDALNTEEKLKKLNANASGQIMAGYQLNHKIQVGGSLYMNQQLGSNFVNYNSRFQSKGCGVYVRWSL